MTTYEITFNDLSPKGKSILNFLKENKVKIKSPTKMTKEEFETKIQIARKQEGEIVTDFEAFGESL